MRGSWKDSPRGWRVMRFLKRQPSPVRVVGETLDGDEVTTAITGTGSAQWADALSALADCWTFKALDKDGNVLRALELDPKDPEFASEADPRSSANGSTTLLSVDVPKLVDNIARNMREVASSAANQQANAFRDGFQAMTSIVNLCLQMLVRVEQRLASAEDANANRSLNGDGQRNQLAMLALQQALGGGPSTPTTQAPTNGGGITISPAMIQGLLEQFMAHGAEGDDHGSG